MPSRPAPTLAALVGGVYLPMLLAQIGVGALIPIIPHAAVTLGATLAIAGVMSALLPAARAAFDIPGGTLLARIGLRRTMLAACAIAVVAYAVAALHLSIWLLAVAIAVVGLSSASLLVATQTALNALVPANRHASTMAALSAVVSVGGIAGPLIGSAIIGASSIWVVMWFCAAATVLAAVAIVLSPLLRQAEASTGERVATRTVLARNRAVLSTVGLGVFFGCVLRGVPQMGLPLWTEHLGFDPATTSLVYAIFAGGVLAGTPVSAFLARRFGRLTPLTITLTGSAALTVVLVFTHATVDVTVCAGALGVLIGIGSGLFLTMATDVVHEDQAEFFGVWRVLIDGGLTAAPILLAVASAASLLAGGLVLGAAMAVPSGILIARFLPRYTPQASRRARRAAGLPVDAG
ncbi:MFS transporter [Microbacterium koreense]|uniref:MFS transporter n=1 Tax=Microbacterium koreense TaxID=323761 RepID=A0ABW2ZMN6_9MICO